ncbi:tachykinin-4 [Monodelphis domestica]|uniref:tachykinin-4 n=1 Tax=Monodelphis domestica TaxID=13616 RepID=UPI0024E231D5|nr:tachykinin-4 [Monodelphis domestica]
MGINGASLSETGLDVKEESVEDEDLGSGMEGFREGLHERDGTLKSQSGGSDVRGAAKRLVPSSSDKRAKELLRTSELGETGNTQERPRAEPPPSLWSLYIQPKKPEPGGILYIPGVESRFQIEHESQVSLTMSSHLVLLLLMCLTLEMAGSEKEEPAPRYGNKLWWFFLNEKEDSVPSHHLVQEEKRGKAGQFYGLMGKRARGKSLIQSVEHKALSVAWDDKDQVSKLEP